MTHRLLYLNKKCAMTTDEYTLSNKSLFLRQFKGIIGQASITECIVLFFAPTELQIFNVNLYDL